MRCALQFIPHSQRFSQSETREMLLRWQNRDDICVTSCRMLKTWAKTTIRLRGIETLLLMFESFDDELISFRVRVRGLRECKFHQKLGRSGEQFPWRHSLPSQPADKQFIMRSHNLSINYPQRTAVWFRAAFIVLITREWQFPLF